ncbi:hypothetical protein UFOVP849_19 [uncultured Caudovirales phage]|uniref:Uncharacterized protein n=1 Tax=uncultured Caudovirales phage TaxID=2100421 RepID=A0A6J5P2Z0_9CAUD|nr:hypothetical protein UFOVP849_19 [uncultured Caudovirales phage]
MKSTQSDKGLKFDGAEAMSPGRVSRDLHKNQWSGHLNDGRLVQMGQQPNRKGNDGSCHHAGYAKEGKMPPTSAVPSLPAQGSVRDNINRGTQHRGGGREFAPSAGQNYKGNPDRINSGRGPTKGNQQ